MASELKDSSLYFRARPNGATVFRVTYSDKQHRTEFTQIATVNIKTGAIRQHDSHTPTVAESSEIDAWISDRIALQAGAGLRQLEDLSERLGAAAHWIQSDASDQEIAAIGEKLLFAMYDLRQTLVRKRAKLKNDG